MTWMTPKMGREGNDQPTQSRFTPRRGSSRGLDPRVEHFPAARLLRLRQWRPAGNRTVAAAPLMTGLTLTGMRRLVSLRRRCHNSLRYRPNQFSEFTGNFAAARELSVVSNRNMPNILSAIQVYNPRLVPPYLILGSSKPCNPSAAKTLSLRSDRTMPPQLGNQLSFGRTHSALPGTTGVGSKTGAAIHEPVVPGESE